MQIDYNEKFKDLFTTKKEVKTWYSSALNELLRYCNRSEETFHLKRFCGSYKHLTLDDQKHRRMLEVLKICKIPYELGNDAKRGGVEGDYIKVKFDGRNAFVKYLRSIK